jgi:hypothetical protein
MFVRINRQNYRVVLGGRHVICVKVKSYYDASMEFQSRSECLMN